VLGILIVILTSATTVSVMTVKPATPKSVIVFEKNSTSETIESIREYVRKGYIIKSVSVDANYHSHIVIMEKY
jgi:hypothetical protein